MRKLIPHEVKYKIERLGMRPFAFAKAHDFVPETLRRWLNGSRNPKINQIVKLAKALNCDISDISEISIKINKNKVTRRAEIFEEIENLAVHLTDREILGILNFVKTLVEERRKTEQEDTKGEST